jgi:two-component system, OmpR family, alkaline phosphatase synthesis response regulator PhoP
MAFLNFWVEYMQKQKILLIEDDEDIAELIRIQAEILGYKIVRAADGLNGYAAVEKELPDVIILDIMLPGQSGFDVCKRIKASSKLSHIPIIILSAKSEETDVVLGLELGADDYVTKPFSPRVLFTRIKAVLRRKGEEEKAPPVIVFGDYSIEIETYLVKKRDKQIPLTLSEFGILRRLVTNRGKVLTRNQLLDDLSNDDAYVVDRNIDVHVAALRRKLGPNFDHIETVRGVGYRFKVDD